MFHNDDDALTAAKLTSLATNTVNMAWMTKIAHSIARDEVPFESPQEMERFALATNLLVTAFASGDREAVCGVLTVMGLAADAREASQQMGKRLPNEASAGEFLSMVREAGSEYVSPEYRAIIDEAVMCNPAMLG